jgi:hypothetical protein
MSGNHPHPTAALAPGAQSLAMNGDDRGDIDVEEIGHMLGFPCRGVGGHGIVTGPDPASADRERRPKRFGVDDPHPAAPDHQVIDVGPAMGQGTVVEDDPPAGWELGEEGGGGPFAGRAARPALRIVTRPGPPRPETAGDAEGEEPDTPLGGARPGQGDGQEQQRCGRSAPAASGRSCLPMAGLSRATGVRLCRFHVANKLHRCDCHTIGEKLMACGLLP